ncbi:homospermidine synthase [Magnetospirillum gryphiswaldense]|uniref:Homospermidine synthase n=1 Tax=Magnetospirillum gryphiswaldense TaxID=55518 RepID=A4TVE6_9PROT|nr:saccharopine dehydrogenase C-terminal domain-containing protein [Magnetospirillum gryphiswaldense]AVM73304.1 Homospermidine synthase [Magnetospirillum gryphiswaldense MSR-1]AVM77207.1 Homospermidine synthase [Magnetospirillum gryphiswaldense]CAM74603.1 homospermidine synthase [Magnetospirillum gryphiswaldense MSR-1]
MSNLVSFDGRVVIIGFGSLGPGVLPLLLRHFNLDASRVTIITAEERGHDIADKYGVTFINDPLTPDNYRDRLIPLLKQGDFLLNVSVDVSSVALIELAWEVGAFYLDTCIEPWAGGYTDPSLTPSERTNYALRETALKLKAAGKQPTAIITNGANPGLVSFFTKQALLDIARDTGVETAVPQTRTQWAELAEKLGIKTIHVAERDTQVSASQPKQVGEFVNTWSIDGFVGEGCQPAELGWGSHERHFPHDGRRHDFGSDCAIYLMRPGASTMVRTWTPNEGPFQGFLVTHNESISIADYFTLKDGDALRYRPTVHYAYHPCDAAVLSVHELAGKTWQQQPKQRLMMKEITGGVDELGVLLMGHAKGAYWYGSQLSIHQARELCPHNNATSLQVTATILAGMVWALENPRLGLVEPDEMDFQRCLEIARPYLGPVVGVYTDWTPLERREELFPEDLDRDDPWQFKNFRVV